MKKMFVFDFVSDGQSNEPAVERRGFVLTLRDINHCRRVADWANEDDYLDFVGNIESYGVHDFGTSGYGELIGYNSYEIRLVDRDTVMNMWHKFLSENDIVCGPILENLNPDDDKFEYLDIDHTDYW